MATKCQCGRGYASAWDGVCGNCRPRKKQKAHLYALFNLPEGLTDAEAKQVYLDLRRRCK